MNKYSNIIRIFFFLVFICLFIVLSQIFPLFNRQELAAVLDNIRGNTHAGPVFIACATVLSIFFVPISWLIATAAVLFGLMRGFLFSLTAATAGAILSFLIAYYLKGNLPAFIHRRLDRSRFSRHTNVLSDNIQNHSLRLMFVLRNIPVPFVAVNYLSGLAAVRFKTFAFGSFLGMIPGIFVSTYFFTKLADTVSNPSGALFGTAVKVIYFGSILLWQHKSWHKNSLMGFTSPDCKPN